LERAGRDDSTSGRSGNEHRFVQEQGTPLLGVGAVGLAAAQEFELATEVSHKAGIAEAGNEFAFVLFKPGQEI